MILSLNAPLDMHLHLREGKMLQNVAPISAACFAGAVIMPNLISPVDTLQKIFNYREDIEKVCKNEIFEPYMTLFFRPYPREILEQVRDHIIGIKLYPAGITTQSESGVTDFKKIEPTLARMEELQIPLLVHGESDGFVLDREREFLFVYQRIVKNFPALHVIMEHITTADAVSFVDAYDTVSATVTLHHLMITLDDVIGGLMQPHLFCKPIAKKPRDLQALRHAVFSGHPRIMFGSDSAPHPQHKKECVGCAAGVFTAPVALPLLAQIFEEADCLDCLQGFVSDVACRRYAITPPAKTIELEDKPYCVPTLFNDVRPFFAGETLRWSIQPPA